MARPPGHRLNRAAFEDLLRMSGLNITKLADISGVPRSTLSALQGGFHGASVPMIQRIAVAIGCNPVSLFPTLNPRFEYVEGADENGEAA